MARDIAVTIRAVDQFSSVFRQYNEALKDVGTSSKTLAATAQQQQNAFSNLATGVKGAIAAYAGLKGLQMVGDMIQLGDAANRAESVFRQLTSSMGGYAANMAAMRQATGGIVDDMGLQEAGAKLLQMGLATTTEEMARLSEMAVKLGGAMGMSVEKSFSDFSLMLANQSIMRLDQFGLSGARVRARMNELKETMGLAKDEAFKMAVLEQGAISLERLGAAADAAVTPMARLQASMANFAQDFSQRVSEAITGIVGIAEIMRGTSPLQAEQRSLNERIQANEMKRFLGQTAGFGSSLELMGLDVGEFDEVGYLSQVKNLMMTDPEGFGQDPFDAAMQVGEQFNWSYDTTERVANMLVQMLQQQQLAQEVAFRERLSDIDVMALDPSSAMFESSSSSLALRARELGSRTTSRHGFTPEYGYGFMPMLGQAAGFVNQIGDMRQLSVGQLAQYEGTYANAANTQVGQYMRQGQADALAREYERIQEDYERLQELSDRGLISEEELNRASDLKDRVGEVADAAARAAENFANMTLGEALGQTKGGIFGEMSDLVMQSLADSGMSEEQLAATQQSLDLASGRETASSVVMTDQVAPMIADIAAQYGPEMAAEAIRNLETFMREATLAGLSQDQIAAALPEATGFAPGTAFSGGQTFDIKAGDTLSAISAQTGIPVSQLLAATGASSAGTVQPGTYSLGGGVNQIAGFDPMAYFSMIMSGGGMSGGMGMAGKGETNIGMLSGGQWGQAGLVGDLTGADTPTDKSPLDAAAEAGVTKLAELNSSAQEAVDKVMEIGTAFDAIPAAVPIRLDLSVNDPSGVFMQLMAALGGADSLAALVADSGGALPGGNPRGGRGANGRPNAGRGGNR